MKTTFRRLGAAARAIALMVGFMAAAQSAHAACTGPNGNAGDIVYASNYNSMAFCNGTSWISMATGGSGGGGATPAGSSADVQFNSSGALAADTGNFTYASGLLKAPNISSTAIQASGQGTFGSLLVNGGMTVSGQASITTVSTSLIQVGNNGAACSSNLAGSQRYNSVSNTMDYCTGTAWMSMGPSATLPVAFWVTRNGVDQSIPNAVDTTIDWTTKNFDTNSNFDLSSDRFTPTIPGYYLLSLHLAYNNNVAALTYGFIRKNGAVIASHGSTYAYADHATTAIVYANGSTDYFDAYGYQSTGAASALGGTSTFTYFTGSILGPQAGGSGGGGSSAGSTNDVQFNSSGVLAADSGNFTYTGGALAAPTVSATSISGTLIQVGSSGSSCVAGLNGSIRYNSTSNTLQICVGTVWTSLSSNTTAASTTQDDRITSGTLSIIANTGSTYASLTTNGTTWGYLSSGASYLPRLQTGFIDNGTISTTLIQTGSNSATCGSGLYGAIRWNATSDTIQICNSGGWVSVASSSVPNTTISQGTASYGAIFSGPNTLVTDSALYADRTNHYIGIGTNTPLSSLHVSTSSIDLMRGLIVEQNNNGVQTPMFTFRKSRAGAAVQNGDYLGVTFAQAFDGNGFITPAGIGYIVSGTVVSGSVPTDLVFSAGNLSSPGLDYERMRISSGGNIGIGTVAPMVSLSVIGEVQISSTGSACSTVTKSGALRYVSGTGVQYCNGANTWTALGGAATTPAGSTGDIQFNTSGAFDADTGQLFWDKSNDRLGLGMSSPAQTLDISGSMRIRTSNITKITLDTPATGQQSSMSYNSNGTAKWLMGKATDDSFYMYDVSASRYDMNVYPSGSMALMAGGGTVGIGMTAPATTLDVSGTMRVRYPTPMQLQIDTTATSQQASMGFYSNGSQKWSLGKNTDDSFYLWDATGSRRILAAFPNGNATLMGDGGNVGIGTYSPGSSLEISTTNGDMSLKNPNGRMWITPGYSGDNKAYIEVGNPGFTGNNAGLVITGYNTNPLTALWLTATNTYASGNVVGSGNITATGYMSYTQANSLAASTDLNTIIANGHYRLAGSTVNSPAASLDYGQLMVSRGLDTILQIGGDYQSANLWFRGGNPSNIGGSGSWGAWRKILYDGISANVSVGGNITATAFLYSSDKRLKSDIRQLTGGLAKLDSINPVSFRFTSDPSKTIHLGLIAQDVQKVYPEAVQQDEKGYLKLDYPALIGPIFDVLKELKSAVSLDHMDLAEAKAEIRQLKADNDNFKSLNADLTANVTSLKAANDEMYRRLIDVERSVKAMAR